MNAVPFAKFGKTSKLAQSTAKATKTAEKVAKAQAKIASGAPKLTVWGRTKKYAGTAAKLAGKGSKALTTGGQKAITAPGKGAKAASKAVKGWRSKISKFNPKDLIFGGKKQSTAITATKQPKFGDKALAYAEKNGVPKSLIKAAKTVRNGLDKVDDGLESMARFYQKFYTEGKIKQFYDDYHISKYIKVLKRLYKSDALTPEDTTGEVPDGPDDLEMGRGAGLSFRETDNGGQLAYELFEGLGVPTDPNTIAAVIAEMKTLGEDESAELLAGLVQQRDEARDEIEEDPMLPNFNLVDMTVAFNRDPYALRPGYKHIKDKKSRVPEDYRPQDKAEFRLRPGGFDGLSPICKKSHIGIGYDLEILSCYGLGWMLCNPAIRDRGQAGMVTDMAWYNEEEEESYYKMTIKREEGFSTPAESTPELTNGGGDMILAPTFAIMFILQDELTMDPRTCTPTARMGIPGWDLKENMDGTAWHSVYHIRNVMIPEIENKYNAEMAKPPSLRSNAILGNLYQGMRGWQDIMKIYDDMNILSKQQEESLPNYVIGDQEINGLVQGTVEGVWQSSLDEFPDRHPDAFEARSIDPERLENDPVWKLGYYEGSEKLANLMLRTQAYMDNSSTAGNIVARPHAKAAMGGVAVGKSVDILQEKYGVQFNTVSFSGGGGSYSYRFKTMSTVSTKIQFQISFKDMFGWKGGGGGGTGFWLETTDENNYGFEIEFDSNLLQETDRERTVSFTLKDKDVGDQFLVKVRPDLAFGTPHFELLAGRSKCPYEAGTQQREGATVSVLGGQNVQSNVKQGTEALYELLIENQSGTDEQVQLELGPDLASNNRSMYMQLMGAPWIQPVQFSLRGPFAAQTRALVSARCSPRYPRASVDIVAKSTCDDSELSRTPLTLDCFSPCPVVMWPQEWPATQPLLFNLSDISTSKTLRLQLFNPAYAIQKWNTHPRLNGTNGTTSIIIEYTNVVSGGGVYLPVRYNNGSFVDFSKLEDPSYGYAVFDWSPASIAEGEYLIRYVAYCDINVGGGTDSRYEGPSISLLVDKVPPVPSRFSLWPNMTYLPGDPLYVDFSEPLDCRKPFAFGVVAYQQDSTGSRSIISTVDLYSSCEGRRITFHWDTINRPTALMPNRTINIQLRNVKDLAGNAAMRNLNLTFFTGPSLTSTAPVTLNYVLGPISTPARRLLFADRNGIVPVQLANRLALRDESEAESLEALVERRMNTRRQLLEQVDGVLTACASDSLLAPLRGSLKATDLLEDDDLLSMVIEFQATGDNTEAAAAAALELVQSARDNSSCLNTQLRSQFAQIRRVFADKGIDDQLLDGVDEEDLAAVRAATAVRAAAMGLPQLWEATVAEAAREQAELIAAMDSATRAAAATQNAAVAAVEGAGKQQEQQQQPLVVADGGQQVDDESGSSLNRRHLGNPAVGAAASAQAQPPVVVAGLLQWMHRNPYMGLGGLVLLGNVTAMVLFGAIWHFRRRAGQRFGAGAQGLLAAAARQQQQRRRRGLMAMLRAAASSGSSSN